ncbi:MAG: alpha/beta hydrolase [Sphingomonadales bacterium]|nr:alpha/beta hydrolase [Sphingomonadales bacterium]
MPSITVNGLSLFYYDDCFVEPWKPAETILINHYGAGDSTLYNGWVPTLAERYRVIRWDRPGYGRSEAPPLGYTLTTQSFVAEIVAFMDALGLEKVHYVGDKATTAAGIVLAATHPERVRSLTLAACVRTAQPIRQLFVDAADEVIAKGSWISAFQSKDSGRDLSGINHMQDLYFRQCQANIPAHVQAAAFRCVADPAFDVTDLLPQVQAPTLLLSPDIYPKGPTLTSRADHDLIRAAIPRCEERVLPGSSMHFPFTDGPWCADQLIRFLDRTAAR